MSHETAANIHFVLFFWLGLVILPSLLLLGLGSAGAEMLWKALDDRTSGAASVFVQRHFSGQWRPGLFVGIFCMMAGVVYGFAMVR